MIPPILNTLAPKTLTPRRTPWNYSSSEAPPLTAKALGAVPLVMSASLRRMLEVCGGHVAMAVVVVVNVNEVLEGHVGLDIECLDRIYLNAYVPRLQMGGQVVTFLRDHLGNPVPSPAVLEKIGTRFRRSVKAFVEDNRIPMIHFGKGDRKGEVMHRYLAAQEKTGRSGVVAVGVAQEYQNVFAAAQRQASNGIP